MIVILAPIVAAAALAAPYLIDVALWPAPKLKERL